MRVFRSVMIVWWVAATACVPSSPDFYGTTYEATDRSEDFTLTDQHGDTFRLADYRGKVVLLFFGYAHCPDICPVTLSTWTRVHEALGDDDEVEFVFITVDPERDTVERLREHMAIYDEDFHGLTGTEEQLEAVYESFGIYRKKIPFSSSAAGYVVDHSATMIVLDREGRLRVAHSFAAAAEEIVHDVRHLLRS